jgi:hypothetical protein
MKKFIFKVSPSKIVSLLMEREESGGTKLPRYLHQVDAVVRESSHFKEWEAEKTKKVVVSFQYYSNYQVFLVLEGRPDFYKIQDRALIEQKKQRIPNQGDPPEIWERFHEDVKRAALQAATYAFMMNLMGERIEKICIHFVWPQKCDSDKIIIDETEIPLVDAIHHQNYVRIIPFGEKEFESMYIRLKKLGLILLERALRLGKSPAQPEENDLGE